MQDLVLVKELEPAEDLEEVVPDLILRVVPPLLLAALDLVPKVAVLCDLEHDEARVALVEGVDVLDDVAVRHRGEEADLVQRVLSV